MKEVSIDEYIDALKIVERYHAQLRQDVFTANLLSKHLIVDFIAKCNKLTASMTSGLLRQKRTLPCQYLEDLNFEKMKTYPGLGSVSIEKLKQYINKYLNEE